MIDVFAYQNKIVICPDPNDAICRTTGYDCVSVVGVSLRLVLDIAGQACMMWMWPQGAVAKKGETQ